MTHNLLSISAIADKCNVKFQQKTCIIEANDGTQLLSSIQNNGLYTVPVYALTTSFTENIQKPAISITEAHQRLGHVNARKIKEMSENNQLPFNIIDQNDEIFVFDTCNATITTRSPIPKESNSVYRKVGDLIHTDIWGPITIHYQVNKSSQT
jgi:hypothetical protein